MEVHLVLSFSVSVVGGRVKLPLESVIVMPLHSMIASSLLQLSLTVESRCWGLVPQGAVVSGIPLFSLFFFFFL